MKMIFLFEKEIRDRFRFGKVIPLDSLPNFDPYKFGPFSSNVFDDLEFLSDIKLIRVKSKLTNEISDADAEELKYWRATSGRPEDDNERLGNVEEFQLSQLGKEFVESELVQQLNNNQMAALADFKARCTNVSLENLLRYVYAKYPSMTKKSEILEKVMR